jgi:hypothetical protein
MRVRRCIFCRAILRNDNERCGTCGRYLDVTLNDPEFVLDHVERRVDRAFAEGRAEQSIRDELINEGFPPELFEQRLSALASQRRRSVRLWGLGQIATGSIILMVGIGVITGLYLSTGRLFVNLITGGVIIFGAATLGRGLQALFFRN